MFKRFAIAATAITAFVAPASAQEPEAMTDGEIELAEMLEGRVAGEPQNCIRTIGNRPLKRIDDTALVYKIGKTLWVNYTRNPSDIDDRDVFVIDKFNATQLCRTDQITLHDRFSGIFSGVLFLEDFVPYKSVESEG